MIAQAVQQNPEKTQQILVLMVQSDPEAAAKAIANAFSKIADKMTEAVRNIATKFPEAAGKVLSQVANQSQVS